jgi:hypothetical protein
MSGNGEESPFPVHAAMTASGHKPAMRREMSGFRPAMTAPEQSGRFVCPAGKARFDLNQPFWIVATFCC